MARMNYVALPQRMLWATPHSCYSVDILSGGAIEIEILLTCLCL
jgi:hypothetical protein